MITVVNLSLAYSAIIDMAGHSGITLCLAGYCLLLFVVRLLLLFLAQLRLESLRSFLYTLLHNRRL